MDEYDELKYMGYPDEVPPDEEEFEIKCDLVGYSKSKAIRKKDEMHSKSVNKFEHWQCINCNKWHISTTGERRMNVKATKNQNPGFAGSAPEDI